MDRRGFMAAAGSSHAATGFGRARANTAAVAQWRPRTYVYCKRINPADTFRTFAERARREHWTYHEIDSSHSPHITAPDALQALLVAQV
jgi:hypothetical protein